jgi:SAM-dependent methyltransferase
VKNPDYPNSLIEHRLTVSQLTQKNPLQYYGVSYGQNNASEDRGNRGFPSTAMGNAMNTSSRSLWLEKLHKARSKKEMAEVYDAWGEGYEHEVMIRGYNMPAIMAGLFGRYVQSLDAPILDVGAGTGILGESLYILGYKNLVAIDFSRGMLEIARMRGFYRDLRQMVLGTDLDFADNTFEAIAVMGVFGKGHASPDALNELIRITRPHGHIIFSIRADEYLTAGFKEKQDALEREMKWQLREITEPFNSLPLGDSELVNRICVHRVY